MTSKIKVDTIEEKTAGNGVSIDSVTLKDGGITYSGGDSVSSLSASVWRLSANSTFGSGATTVFTSNLEAVDTPSGYGALGSAMSESSGVFTFPSTGIYMITAVAYVYANSAQSVYNGIQIQTTPNDSSYSMASTGYSYIPNVSDAHGSSTVSTIFDVTSTSTHKVRFAGQSGAAVVFGGSSTVNYTHFIFQRLGDT
tara:strand:+ start:27457 stop:28047 length:591 start_codon:yes stop_codon:yes gene_type:complete